MHTLVLNDINVRVGNAFKNEKSVLDSVLTDLSQLTPKTMDVHLCLSGADHTTCVFFVFVFFCDFFFIFIQILKEHTVKLV